MRERIGDLFRPNDSVMRANYEKAARIYENEFSMFEEILSQCTKQTEISRGKFKLPNGKIVEVEMGTADYKMKTEGMRRLPKTGYISELYPEDYHVIKSVTVEDEHYHEIGGLHISFDEAGDITYRGGKSGIYAEVLQPKDPNMKIAQYSILERRLDPKTSQYRGYYQDVFSGADIALPLVCRNDSSKLVDIGVEGDTIADLINGYLQERRTDKEDILLDNLNRFINSFGRANLRVESNDERANRILKNERDAATEEGDQLRAQMKEANEMIARLTAERDAAVQENEGLRQDLQLTVEGYSLRSRYLEGLVSRQSGALKQVREKIESLKGIIAPVIEKLRTKKKGLFGKDNTEDISLASNVESALSGLKVDESFVVNDGSLEPTDEYVKKYVDSKKQQDRLDADRSNRS